jgi:putative DNA primase/helicase
VSVGTREDLEKAAFRYHHRGFWPIPLKPRSKQTSLRELAPFLKRRATPDELLADDWQWGGVGLVTGRGPGLLVLDADGPEGEAALKERGHPPTPIARTGGGGLHIYFRHPGGELRTRIRLAPGLDVKADGGYVAAPPSIGPTGGQYEWIMSPEEVDFADPPEWLMGLLAKPQHKGSAPPVGDRIPPGQRNQELTSIAGSMRRRGMDEEEIGAALEVVNRRRCDPPLEEDEVLKIAASVARYAPAHDRRRPPPEEEAVGAPEPPSMNGRRVVARLDPEDRRGLTVSLAEAIKGRRRFAKDAGGKLYHYEAGFYQPGGDERIAVEVKHLLAESKISAKWSTHRSKEVTEYIRVDAPRLWEQPPRDRINVLNGILDIVTGELGDHTPEFLSSVQLPVLYYPEADCPAWDRYISAWFPEDARQLAYEIPGWLATPDTSIQKAILLLGEGANGKSSYLAALGAFIGRENFATLSLQKIEADRFAAARLVGKLANICPDLPSDHLSSTSTFKAITGGDPISAEYKYGSSFDLRPFARLVFSANHPPRSGDASHAFYRRWLVVPFDQSFEPGEQRPRDELDSELSDPRELSGVLNRALEALRGIRRRGGFSESISTRDALAEFQKTTDPLSVWLDRNTVEHPEAMVAQDELRRAFNQFAENSGKPGMTAQAFGRALARVKPGIEKAQRTWRGVSNTRVYLGIGLRSEAIEERRDQRDQRDDPNCFKEEEGAVIENNKSQRVDRVESAPAGEDPRGGLRDHPSPTSSPSGGRLSAGEAEEVKRLVGQGMKAELARAEVLGKRKDGGTA